MSHHDTTDVQTQLVERIKSMMTTIIIEESLDVPTEITETVHFASLEADGSSFYSFTHNGETYSIILGESDIDGILRNDDISLAELDDMIYDVLTVVEMDNSWDDEDEDDE